MGPPCPVEGCKGVLWDTINHKTGMSWKQCTECGEHVDEMPTKVRLAKAIETIERIFKESHGQT